MEILPTVPGYHIPLLYRIYLGLFEPLSAVNGTFLLVSYPEHFYLLNGLLPSSPDTVLPTATIVALYQLGIMYGSFGVTEAIVLHLSDSMRTWRIYIASLLLSDVGILWTMHPLGRKYYWSPGEWNYIAGGSYAICYICIIVRLCFVFGVGIKKTGTVRS